jgi:hypothetical protein
MMLLIPSELFERLKALRELCYTGTMTLDFKDGKILSWCFSVREKTSETTAIHSVPSRSIGATLVKG